MAVNYVKFRRGNNEAFQALLKDGATEIDTLYFIYEEDSASGSLYLGSKLIAGTATAGVTELAKLDDVKLLDELHNKECLIYDITKNSWVNKPINDILPIFVGTNGESGSVAGLVPAAGNNSNLFLRSDGTWAEIIIDPIDADNVSLETVNGALTIVGFHDAPEGAQPVKNSDGSLSWIKPDLTAVEILQDDVKNI